MKDKDLIKDLLKKGFLKYDIINALMDLHIYGFTKMYDTDKKGVYAYELTDKGRVEAEVIREDIMKKVKRRVTRPL